MSTKFRSAEECMDIVEDQLVAEKRASNEKKARQPPTKVENLDGFIIDMIQQEIHDVLVTRWNKWKETNDKKPDTDKTKNSDPVNDFINPLSKRGYQKILSAWCK